MGPSPKSRVDLARMREEYDKFRGAASGDREKKKIIIRATAHVVENVHLKGTVRGFDLESDEPPERGGTNRGPAPLSYFVIGAAF